MRSTFLRQPLFLNQDRAARVQPVDVLVGEEAWRDQRLVGMGIVFRMFHRRRIIIIIVGLRCRGVEEREGEELPESIFADRRA
jgi:hypothetical protein